MWRWKRRGVRRGGKRIVGACAIPCHAHTTARITLHAPRAHARPLRPGPSLMPARTSSSLSFRTFSTLCPMSQMLRRCVPWGEEGRMGVEDGEWGRGVGQSAGRVQGETGGNGTARGTRRTVGKGIVRGHSTAGWRTPAYTTRAAYGAWRATRWGGERTLHVQCRCIGTLVDDSPGGDHHGPEYRARRGAPFQAFRHRLRDGLHQENPQLHKGQRRHSVEWTDRRPDVPSLCLRALVKRRMRASTLKLARCQAVFHVKLANLIQTGKFG